MQYLVTQQELDALVSSKVEERLRGMDRKNIEALKLFLAAIKKTIGPLGINSDMTIAIMDQLGQAMQIFMHSITVAGLSARDIEKMFRS